MSKKLICTGIIGLLVFFVSGIFFAFGFENELEKAFLKDVKSMEQEYNDFEKKSYEKFQREVKSMWGDFITSTKKTWVGYSDDKTGRSRVDFEKGKVQIEVVLPEKIAAANPEAMKKKLEKEIERTVTDKGECFNKTSVLPYAVLEGQVKNKHGDVVTEKNRIRFAREIFKTKPVKKISVTTDKGRMTKARLSFFLVPDHIKIRAEKYLAPVQKYSKRFKVSVPLVFAIIHTESFFNPKAKSSAPAFGLMQLVPKSGGRAAYKYAYGRDRILSSNYLYNPENNIELGCAYLGLLKNQYFKDISNNKNALYCVIASYNTGPGNLGRSFCGKRDVRCAVDRANSMNADELFRHLRSHLPYRETREYLKKVTDRMNIYKNL